MMMMMMMMNIKTSVGEVNYFEISWMEKSSEDSPPAPPGMEDYIRTELALNPSSVAGEE